MARRFPGGTAAPPQRAQTRGRQGAAVAALWAWGAVGGAHLGRHGFFGAAWQGRWRREYGAAALTPRNYGGEAAKGWRRRHRSRLQVAETVNGLLEQVFHLHFPKARSRWGLLTRVSAKVAALNLGIWVNRQLGRPSLALATLFSS